MKRYLILFLTINILNANVNIDYISKNKKSIFDLQKKEVLKSSKKLKYSWISPLMFKYSINKSKQASTDLEDESRVFSIGLNQDIFRSGGIYYAMEFANIQKELNLLNIKMQVSNLNKAVVLKALAIKSSI